MFELILLLRMAVSIILGFAIGFERKLRMKEAAVRTHAVVAAGACLMMLVSKYGFSDSTSFDPSRVASQIVSGIGFIGAGMILYRKQAVHGLTTAAGIWATAGVGMAIGSGMYILGSGAAVLIIVCQYVMHLPSKIFVTKNYYQLKVCFFSDENEIEIVKKLFNVDRFVKINFTRREGKLIYIVVISTDFLFPDTFLNDVITKKQFISSIERIDDD